jgi:hypothetical protein
MDPIIWEREPPELRSPVLVASFSGWNDAASAAGTALGAIGASLETELVARIDPEEFFDFQANRPTIEISGGTMQNVEWPDNLIVAAQAEGAERDLLLISGTEPSTRWRTFCTSVLDVAAGITGQDFEPRPDFNVCSWCDYRLICPASEA